MTFKEILKHCIKQCIISLLKRLKICTRFNVTKNQVALNKFCFSIRVWNFQVFNFLHLSNNWYKLEKYRFPFVYVKFNLIGQCHDNQNAYFCISICGVSMPLETKWCNQNWRLRRKNRSFRCLRWDCIYLVAFTNQ